MGSWRWETLGWVLLWGGTICTPRVWLPDGFVLIRDGKIYDLGPLGQLPGWVDVSKSASRLSSITEMPLQEGQWEPVEVVDTSGRYITPGLIDIHIHGAMGCDVMEADRQGLARMAQGLARFGTTSFVATTVSASFEELKRVLSTAQQTRDILSQCNAAEPLGFHVEGPYINVRRKGAHEPKVLRNPDLDELGILWDLTGDFWRTITLAPEIPGAMDAIRWLTRRGVVVSLGHSTADFSTVDRAVSLGASHCTHLYNGMEPLHHRNPGLVGAALSDDRLTVELIVDTIHVDLPVIAMTLRAKGWQRVALVSDGMQAVGLPDGEYQLGDLTVYVKDGACRLADGTIASSTVTLDRSVRILVKRLGIGFREAVAMASLVPAQVIGVAHRKGELAVGKDADVAIWNPGDLTVEAVVLRGHYQKVKRV